ncbi:MULTISPECIES: hypothetical protein [unclassified Mesorhizobium]|uniref:hypothetical protein n=1 Tax=unclassified Mesorhizobium TaxID=325217 RepID=UPI001091A999|nr:MULTISPECIES: hypothetical protein [unclassified Mesorhizobium]TGU40145.1 hypothetical protein EN799_06855 [bacterium M00.F.Ca.ET.156.01.1.1]TGV15063.1 hypothetical protein EN816_06415 [Mesorhizobium sp. M8A.F.Ca.ET.173.01.1.1]TGQ77172.1 hypothetical protein EN850_29915 [Mesorhizobium sp. M8A.F.Ca.ET.207.01.1.1]TGQ89162.1 hypothetical protein EN851_23040 [Mesorhizobium sp. M8A.F.Ca.ET.208.01.1.1]TGR32266.1 hypothetical protein EN845_06855 [Mesorhizobium sp. M8A.F.Ca.ET.202.01.1.1]
MTQRKVDRERIERADRESKLVLDAERKARADKTARLREQRLKAAQLSSQEPKPATKLKRQ